MSVPHDSDALPKATRSPQQLVRRRRRAVRVMAGGLLVASSMGILLRDNPSGASTLGGAATIADPSNNQALTSGGSTTVFTVTLPAGAACSGDTANDGYHVYSFLVPHGTDVTTVHFVNFPSTGYGFVDNASTYYGPANTAINTGQIIGIPTNFEWGPLAVTGGGSVPLATLLNNGTSATWDAGLVCAKSTGAVSDSWSTSITFTAAGSDPSGFTWATGSAPPPTSTTTDAGATTTTDAGATTTTDAGATTTTDAGATTTTAAGATTTTDAGDTTTTQFSDTTSPPVSAEGSTTSVFVADPGADPGTGSGGGSGNLAFTGSSTARVLAIAMLVLGLGLMLLGSDLHLRGRRRWHAA